MIFRWMARKGREGRAIAYLKHFPNDEPAVQAILFSVAAFNAKSARNVAAITAGRDMTDKEWAEVGARWERAWNAIIR